MLQLIYVWQAQRELGLACIGLVSRMQILNFNRLAKKTGEEN